MKEEGFTGASKDMMIVRYKAVYERGARVDQAEFNAFRLIHVRFAKPRPAAHSTLAADMLNPLGSMTRRAQSY